MSWSPPQAIDPASPIVWFKGQREEGQGGYAHWQFCIALKKKMRMNAVKLLFCPEAHLELTRSDAAESYVCKEETRVAGTEFEIGVKAMKLNSKVDWEKQLNLAKRGRVEEMDPGVLMRCYNTVKKIGVDFGIAPADADDVTGVWIWGPPGVGKSRKARDDNPGIFDKPCHKWWDGYRACDHSAVLMDDFDKVHRCLGHYLKRWTDRYSFNAEVKGGSVMIRPKKVIVTSNYSIEEIFGDDVTLVAALRRRMEVIHMTEPYGGLPLGPYDLRDEIENDPN